MGAYGGREKLADWTVQAWEQEWRDSRIRAVMPFPLQDGAWDELSWLQTSEATCRVSDTVRDWRSALVLPELC